MAQMQGVITIVQEGRFALMDDDGVSHLFTLSYAASAEPDQLAPLQQEQARVRVRYRPASNLIGLVARSVDLVDDQQPGDGA